MSKVKVLKPSGHVILISQHLAEDQKFMSQNGLKLFKAPTPPPEVPSEKFEPKPKKQELSPEPSTKEVSDLSKDDHWQTAISRMKGFETVAEIEAYTKEEKRESVLNARKVLIKRLS